MAGDEQEYTDPIAPTDLRTLALYELLRLRLTRDVTPNTVAAGVDWLLTVPNGSVWELVSVFARLTTSAAVANRIVRLEIKNPDGNRLALIASNFTQTASDTEFYTWGSGLGAWAQASAINAPLLSPPMPLYQGCTIGSLTAAIDAADQFSQMRVLVRDWSVGQVYWAANLIGNESLFEVPTDLPTITPEPVGTGQPIPVSPLAR